jgi:hypothetical protein
MYAEAKVRGERGDKAELAAIGAWFDDHHLYIDRLAVGHPNLTAAEKARHAEAHERAQENKATPEDHAFLARLGRRRVRSKTLIFRVYHDKKTFTPVRVEWGGWEVGTHEHVTLDRI